MPTYQLTTSNNGTVVAYSLNPETAFSTEHAEALADVRERYQDIRDALNDASEAAHAEITKQIDALRARDREVSELYLEALGAVNDAERRERQGVLDNAVGRESGEES